MAQLAVVAVMAVSSIYKGMKEQEAAYEQADTPFGAADAAGKPAGSGERRKSRPR